MFQTYWLYICTFRICVFGLEKGACDVTAWPVLKRDNGSVVYDLIVMLFIFVLKHLTL